MMSQGFVAKLVVTLTASVLAAASTAYVTIEREQGTQDARLVALEDLARDNRQVLSEVRDRIGLIQADVGEVKGEVKILAGKEVYGRR